jgi:hypothetical protein
LGGAQHAKAGGSIAKKIAVWMMTRREREHYEIAKKFGIGRPFTSFEFKCLYRQEYPKRASPPIPTDFCINLYANSAKRFPKFLRWLGRGRYEFIDEQRE